MTHARPPWRRRYPAERGAAALPPKREPNAVFQRGEVSCFTRLRFGPSFEHVPTAPGASRVRTPERAARSALSKSACACENWLVYPADDASRLPAKQELHYR